MRKITATLPELQKSSIRLSLFFLCIYFSPFFLIWGGRFIAEGKIFLSLKPVDIALRSSINCIVFFSSVLVGIVVHELIHGICFSLFCKNGFKSISFGTVNFPQIFYTHCKEPLSRMGFWIGTLAPAFLLGLVPATIGLWKGSFVITLFGFIFSSLAVGDFLIVYKAKGLTKWARIIDNADDIGVFITDETERQ